MVATELAWHPISDEIHRSELGHIDAGDYRQRAAALEGRVSKVLPLFGELRSKRERVKRVACGPGIASKCIASAGRLVRCFLELQRSFGIINRVEKPAFPCDTYWRHKNVTWA